MSNSQTRNGGGDLVLDDLDLDPRAGDFLAVLDRADPADVDPARAVELQRPAARRRLRAAEHDADLLADLVDEDEDALRPRDRAGELAQGLAHEPGLEADVAVADLAFDLGLGHQGGDRVDHDDVDGVGVDQHLGDLERLLGTAGLADQQGLDVDAEPLAPRRVERVLGVDERGDAPVLLGIGDRMQGDGRLAARLRPEQLDDPAAREPLALRARSSDRAPVEMPSTSRWLPSPSFMIAPAPNVFSIWLMALFSAFVSAETAAGLTSVVPCRLATTIAPSRGS